MKKILLIVTLSVCIAGIAQAQVLWQGDAAGTDSNKWDVGENWSSASIPTNATDVEFNVTTGLAFTNRGVVIGQGVTDSFANSVTVDIADFAVRPVDNNDKLNIETSMTFTSNFTGTNPITTFSDAGSGARNLRLSVGANFTMTNNGTGTVTFDATNGGNDFGITSIGSSSDFTIDGTGNFQFDGGVVFAGINNFDMRGSGSLTIGGGIFNNSGRIGVLGGTVDINGGDINSGIDIGNGASIEIDGYNGIISGDLTVFAAGGNLLADGTTDVSFTDLLGSGVIDITGWVEGSSSIVFTGLTLGVTEGQAADSDFTLSGSSGLFWTEVSAGTWGLTAVPEPGTYALLAGALSLLCVMIRRRK